MFRTKEAWAALLLQMELLWTHDGNPRRPHALLTKGGHSNGFFNGGKLLFDHPRLARELAADLVELVDWGQYLPPPTKVVSPAFGAITWAGAIADALDIKFAFTVPDGEGESKKFKLEKRFDLSEDLVLPAEDTITTGDSVGKTIEVAVAGGADIAPIILAICNRSGLDAIDGRRIIAMIDKHMENWAPEVCPLCKLGSKAIRPKEAQNWSLLSAKY